jgi:Flp pilus assembly protein TadD
VAAATDLYRQGLAAYGRRDFPGAIETYRKALLERPEWSDCMQALGMALMHAGQLDEALRTMERVTELTPEEPLAFTSLSMCLQRLNRIADAETAQAKARLLSWKRELKANPNAPPPTGGMPVSS